MMKLSSTPVNALSAPIRNESPSPITGKIGAPQRFSVASGPAACRIMRSPSRSASTPVTSCERWPANAPAYRKSSLKNVTPPAASRAI